MSALCPVWNGPVLTMSFSNCGFSLFSKPAIPPLNFLSLGLNGMTLSFKTSDMGIPPVSSITPCFCKSLTAFCPCLYSSGSNKSFSLSLNLFNCVKSGCINSGAPLTGFGVRSPPSLSISNKSSILPIASSMYSKYSLFKPGTGFS